ncbi:helix-turn-helix transcriptional regulator [Microbacterium lacticum]|nr:helix-turn-helix transcriptional regulator [Microbacterium lacticum]MBF9335091.1 helix-turn-helix transcriptional regulator [Microbacterium lacticum]
MNVTLGANLRAIRQSRGLSQQDFAHHLGYDRTYVASVERGQRNLTLDTVSDLADRLG